MCLRCMRYDELEPLTGACDELLLLPKPNPLDEVVDELLFELLVELLDVALAVELVVRV